jgi:hypothetical protein
MVCARRSMIRGSVLGMTLLAACSLSKDGVTDPMPPPAPGQVQAVPDAGPPVTAPQGMSVDGAAPPDLAAPVDSLRPDQAPASGPPGWKAAPLVVAVGQGGRRVVSSSGVEWSGDTRDVPGDRDPTKDLRAVAYAGGLVVAVGGGCSGTQCLADGKRWTAKGMLPADVQALVHGSVGGTPMFIAVGDDGLRARSADGQTWTDVQQGLLGTDTPVALNAVAIGNGTVVAAGGQGRRIRSRNGIDWIDPAAGGSDLGSLVFADQTFLAYSDNGIVFISADDGRSWNPQVLVDPPRQGVATGMMRGTRLYVASRGELILTSNNGLAWSARPEGSLDVNTLNAFVFAGY